MYFNWYFSVYCFQNWNNKAFHPTSVCKQINCNAPIVLKYLVYSSSLINSNDQLTNKQSIMWETGSITLLRPILCSYKTIFITLIRFREALIHSYSNEPNLLRFEILFPKRNVTKYIRLFFKHLISMSSKYTTSFSL